jgi:hypothetical protein
MREHPITTAVALGQLADEITAALGLPDRVALAGRNPGQRDEDGNPLPGVVGVPDDLDAAKVQGVIDTHQPATGPTPDDDLAARIQAVHDDPDVPDSVKKLTAALLGLNGEAAVAGRPTDTGR